MQITFRHKGHVFSHRRSGALCNKCGAQRLIAATIAWRHITRQREEAGQSLESSKSKGRGRMILVFLPGPQPEIEAES